MDELKPEAQSVPNAQPIDVEVPKPERRGPGRPKGSGTKKTTDTAHSRKSTSKPRSSSKKEAADPDALAKQVMGLHQFAAMATGIQELAISEVEAQMLAGGLEGVAREYGLSVSGKTGAALQLFAAAAMVYVPRIGRIQAKAKANAEAKQAAQAAAVVSNFETPIDPNPPKAKPVEPKPEPAKPNEEEARAAQAAAMHSFNAAMAAGDQVAIDAATHALNQVAA